MEAELRICSQQTLGSLLSCLSSFIRARFSIPLPLHPPPPNHFVVFSLFRAVGVKLHRLRVWPRLKALTGTLLGSGATRDGIYFRSGTRSNPVTRSSMREEPIRWDLLRSCAITRMTLAVVIDERRLGMLLRTLKVMR